MKKELKILLGSLSFFTRIPVRSGIGAEECLSKSIKYFSLIGCFVGVFQVLVFFLMQYILPTNVCILLSLLSGVLVTGALHEDGFIDTCDSLAGKNKEDVLRIMKDSRVGAYGVIGYLALFLLKFELLVAIADKGYLILAFSFIAAHAVSRLLVFVIILTGKYVGDIGSKSRLLVSGEFVWQEVLISMIFGILPVLFFGYKLALIVLLVLWCFKVLFSKYFNKRIGGYTGDCLGAAQQVSELIFYLIVIAGYRLI